MYLEPGHTAARHSKLAVMRMPNDFGCSVATHFIKKFKHFEKKKLKFEIKSMHFEKKFKCIMKVRMYINIFFINIETLI